MINIKRTDIRLKADPRKVILKFLDFGHAARFEPVVQYVAKMEESAAMAQLMAILDNFEERHFNLKGAFMDNFARVAAYVPVGDLSFTKKLLLGAYFTHEYSIQAAALFNPSIVPHPDQSGLTFGDLRFVMSLRATGEGHISSIVFQTGVVNAAGDIALDPVSPKLSCGKPAAGVADSCYNLTFDPDTPLSSRVLFPHSAAEANGMEDARFVQFTDKEKKWYLGTYTAYNGRAIHPHLIETLDFQHFKIRPFTGKAASDKGFALFPEKVQGKYAMIGRQGGRNLSIMFSDDLCHWDDYSPLQQPQRGWEMLQMGNCGSPVKTPQGWLLLTHAVGPMRKYVLSVTLLDLNDPGKVPAGLERPLLCPNEEEREGYVPNVLYTCGMLAHGGRLVIPYAMSDNAISFATVETDEVLAELKKS
jgi:predicted GH43/DUF377 family glycosyl hydrolase